MSLAAPYQEHYYIADGETTRFSFGEYFYAPASANVKCIIYFEDGTNCVPSFNVDITTGYIDIITLTTPDGQVLNAPPAGSSVRVFRDTPEQQNVTASQLQNYTAKQLEKIFDSIVAMIQEVSYSDKHKTLRLTETQRDVFLSFLKEANNDALLYWDNESRTIVPTNFVHQDVVRMAGGLFFRAKNDSQLRPYLEWSRNGQTDWNSLNLWAPVDIANEAKEIAQEAKEIAQNAKDVADDAKDVADDAKDIAQDAKETAEGIEDIAQEALDKVTQEITDREDADEDLQDQITDNKGAIEDHVADTNNPHSVTKAQVGLGNVDNTSDLDKPISTATQSALDLKMPISTKYGASLSLTIDSSTYVVTAQLKDQDNNNLGTAQTIDLPLESVVVSGSYDSDTKEVILVLESGSEIRFSVADLISGLQSEITAQNPLDADLVNDSTSAHKFVTATEKTNWNNHIASTNNPHQVTKAQVGLGNVDNTSDLNKPISTATQTALDLKADKSTTYTKTETDTLLSGKQDVILDLATIRSGAGLGATALQPNDNISELNNDVGYTTNVGTVTSVNNTQPDANGNVTISTASAVSDLTDVQLTNLTDGQTLVYDSSSSKWVNGNGGVSASYDSTTKTITFA